MTLKFSDVNVNNFVIDSIKFKDGKKQNLIKYLHEGEKYTLVIQGPWIKLSQYGLPPGEKLANGATNDFYDGEDKRDSIKFPIDTRCNVVLANGQTNETEIEKFIAFLKAVDKRITSEESQFMELSGIDRDDIGKYMPCYRKPGKSKKAVAEPREKYYSFKTKLNTKYSAGKEDDEAKQYTTKFLVFDDESGEFKPYNDGQQVLSVEDVEKIVTYQSEAQPLFTFVKLWEQQTGWGATSKLIKARVKRNEYQSATSDPDFIDADDEQPVVSKPTKVETAKPVAKQPVKVQQVQQLEEDEDDDAPVKAVPKAVKQVAQVEEDEDDQESDGEEIKRVTKVVAKPAAKPVAKPSTRGGRKATP